MTAVGRVRPVWSRPQLLAGPLVVASSGWVAVVLVVHHLSSDRAPGSHEAIDHALLMAAAMTMVAAPSARLAVSRSLERRWLTCLGAHIAGYAAVWFVVALGLNLVVLLLPGSPWVRFGVLLAGATAWQLSRARRKQMERVGWVPTGPPTGWAALAAELRGGASQSSRCVVACWASMLAMAAAPTITLGLVVLAADLDEWRPGANPHGRTRRTRPAIVYALGVVAAILVAFLTEA